VEAAQREREKERKREKRRLREERTCRLPPSRRDAWQQFCPVRAARTDRRDIPAWVSVIIWNLLGVATTRVA